MNRQFLASDQHVKVLTEAVRDRPSHTLEALTVWWSRAKFYVIDGHHRLEAYKQAKAKGVKLPSIPVIIFDGSLNEAVREAATRNSRDKLAMTRDDKLERAWKLVCLPDARWSKADIAEATGVSDGSVANMRRTKVKLEADGHTLLDWTWAEAKRGEAKEIGEDFEERQAIELQKRLVKHFGKTLSEQPTIFARALELYAERLPRLLVDHWPDQAQEVIDLRAATDEPGGDF